MISNKEIQAIDRQYFDVLETTAFYVVLRSRNTGHFWHLLEQHPGSHVTFLISHKHHEWNPYHPQANRPTIDDCCKYIKWHDRFHKQREKEKQSRRVNNDIPDTGHPS